MTTLADSAAAWVVLGKDNIQGNPATAEMKINYMKLVCSGKVFVEAKNVHEGSRKSGSEVEDRNEGKLVAKSLLTYMW